MDLFFTAMRGKQLVYVDVGQGAKVSAIQDIIKALLDLPEVPRLLKPKVITDAVTRHDTTKLEWEPMDPTKTLTSYGYNKENALAHEPIPLAFLFPEDEEKPFITPLSEPRPIPDEIKGEGEPEATGSSA